MLIACIVTPLYQLQRTTSCNSKTIFNQLKKYCTRVLVIFRKIILLIYLVTYLLTYSMEECLLENLIGSQLVKNFSAFYGIRRFIIAFTSAHHLSLS